MGDWLTFRFCVDLETRKLYLRMERMYCSVRWGGGRVVVVALAIWKRNVVEGKTRWRSILPRSGDPWRVFPELRRSWRTYDINYSVGFLVKEHPAALPSHQGTFNELSFKISRTLLSTTKTELEQHPFERSACHGVAIHPWGR